ncbi:uncharacterized protein TNCV_2084291 [Trichonephila clavipes]|uniref:Uncharacterized protein n=1 Tax=Trichonephila clavipes TaxID=2585209 RepID=A0A8X6V7D7_TRICX|nr:uncharacterized protein TNCV_2084291 [Trichonephila clavipes]
MSRTDESMISIYEKKILRFIFGGIQENGAWRRRSSLKLYQLYKESGIVNFIKIQGIKWADHVVRKNDDRATKKVFNAQPISTRRKSRSNLRCIDGLEKDILALRIRNWRRLAGRRLSWKRFLEKAKTHPWLLCH